MPGHRAAGRVLRKAWAFPAILLSGALMFVAAGPTAVAAPGPQSRTLSVETDDGSSGSVVSSADDLPDPSSAAKAGSPAGKVSYGPPTSWGCDVSPLDQFLLHVSDTRGRTEPADSGWAATDPDRGPPAGRQ